MPQRGSGDPLLKGKDWEATKAYWRRQRVPTCQAPQCKARHVPIDYEGPRGPFSLDVGHIVSRDQAKTMGWPRTLINAITNTRPEHATCSRSAGARDGNRKRSTSPQRMQQTKTSRVW